MTLVYEASALADNYERSSVPRQGTTRRAERRASSGGAVGTKPGGAKALGCPPVLTGRAVVQTMHLKD